MANLPNPRIKVLLQGDKSVQVVVGNIKKFDVGAIVELVQKGRQFETEIPRQKLSSVPSRESTLKFLHNCSSL